MGSLFKVPKPPAMSMPSVETPAVPQIEGKEEISKFLKKRKGRENTILAGMLEPSDIGKRTLLG